MKHVQLLIVFKHPDPAGRNPADPDICRMYDIRHFRNSEPDSGTPLVVTGLVRNLKVVLTIDHNILLS